MLLISLNHNSYDRKGETMIDLHVIDESELNYSCWEMLCY